MILCFSFYLGEYDRDAFAEAWENSFADLMYVPATKKFGLNTHLTDESKVFIIFYCFLFFIIIICLLVLDFFYSTFIRQCDYRNEKTPKESTTN